MFDLARYWRVSPREVFDLPIGEIDKWARHARRINEAEKEAAKPR